MAQVGQSAAKSAAKATAAKATAAKATVRSFISKITFAAASMDLRAVPSGKPDPPTTHKGFVPTREWHSPRRNHSSGSVSSHGVGIREYGIVAPAGV